MSRDLGDTGIKVILGVVLFGLVLLAARFSVHMIRAGVLFLSIGTIIVFISNLPRFAVSLLRKGGMIPCPRPSSSAWERRMRDWFHIGMYTLALGIAVLIGVGLAALIADLIIVPPSPPSTNPYIRELLP